MKVSDAFPSKYLKAGDIPPRAKVRVVIADVQSEDIGGENKPVMFFKNKSKGMVLNKTNAGRIAVVYGDETDDWIGKELFVFADMVEFQGRRVPAIRVDVPRQEVVASDFADEQGGTGFADEDPPLPDDEPPF